MGDVERRPLTGSPAPRPVWQVVCEFANGMCLCAKRTDKPPCNAALLAQAAVLERVAYEAALRREERRGR
jgi:hypothetical protein